MRFKCVVNIDCDAVDKSRQRLWHNKGADGAVSWVQLQRGAK